jgi:hypothetical protein
MEDGSLVYDGGQLGIYNVVPWIVTIGIAREERKQNIKIWEFLKQMPFKSQNY